MYSDRRVFFQNSPEMLFCGLKTLRPAFYIKYKICEFLCERNPAVALFLIFHCRCYQRLGFRFRPLASNTRGMTVDIRMPDEACLSPQPIFAYISWWCVFVKMSLMSQHKAKQFCIPTYNSQRVFLRII